MSPGGLRAQRSEELVGSQGTSSGRIEKEHNVVGSVETVVVGVGGVHDGG